MNFIQKTLLCSIFAIFAFIAFSPSMVEANTASTKSYTKVWAAHILVPTKEEADALKKRVDHGEDFAQLAKKYSTCPSGRNGGDLGYFGKGQMVAPFEKAAFESQEMTVTAPVKTQFGWHLIKVMDKR